MIEYLKKDDNCFVIIQADVYILITLYMIDKLKAKILFETNTDSVFVQELKKDFKYSSKNEIKNKFKLGLKYLTNLEELI